MNIFQYELKKTLDVVTKVINKNATLLLLYNTNLFITNVKSIIFPHLYAEFQSNSLIFTTMIFLIFSFPQNNISDKNRTFAN